MRAVPMGGDQVFRIVLGVDGSPPSRLALEWAVAEARHRGGR
jgi:nucleotide-binding universal stress UspA family protein